MTKLRNLTILLSFFSSSLLASQNLVENFNKKIQEDGIYGKDEFKLINNDIIYEGEGFSPAFAVNFVLDSLEITKGYGSSIDPFKKYTYTDFIETSLSKLYKLRGFVNDGWKEKRDGRGYVLGIDLLREAREKLGPGFFKDIYEHEKRVADSNRFWENFQRNIVPKMVETFRNPVVIALSFLAVFLLIGLPVLIWNFSKMLFSWMFERNPTVLGHDDSDINHGFLKRIFYRYKKLPEVIVNSDLAKKLKKIEKNNQKITKKNKGGIWTKPVKTPYPHILIYGDFGVGKTLFAKKLAKKSGMHFIYMSVGDICQLPEELALEDIKRFFRMARRNAPCVLIVDEADTLFPSKDGDGTKQRVHDPKIEKIKVLFQKEFSKAVDTDIQMVLVTNYPWDLPGAILNRISKKIWFTNPNLETQKKVFALHLKIAFAGKREKINTNDFVDDLSLLLLKGLVGRDIEAIAHDLALVENPNSDDLVDAIKDYKKDSEDMLAYKKLKMKEKEEGEKKKETKQKKKSYWFN